MEQYAISRRGLVRESNQDRAGGFSLDGRCLAFVADGMGGHYAGEQASEIVSQACAQQWEALVGADQRPGFLQSVDQVRAMLQGCHETIAALMPPPIVCGTTAVVLWLCGEEYALFSVGDSRCYQVARRMGLYQAVQMTHDDVSTEPATAGKLLRALGPGLCTLSVQTGRVAPGMLFALCSDGVYKPCPDFVRALRRPGVRRKSLVELAEKIAAQVEQAGAPDNYSLVLVRT